LISECEVPEPIKLNCWKHHCRFIREQLSGRSERFSKDELKKILLLIGESQMDLYLGKFSPKQISSYIIKELKKMNVFQNKDYKKWLSEKEKHFGTVTLPDKSVWILRDGNEKERYIHIHPGRYSPSSIRVKALTLKSAIAVVNKFGVGLSKELFLSDVNTIRKGILNQPPLKSISPHSGQGKIILTLCGQRNDI